MKNNVKTTNSRILGKPYVIGNPDGWYGIAFQVFVKQGLQVERITIVKKTETLGQQAVGFVKEKKHILLAGQHLLG